MRTHLRPDILRLVCTVLPRPEAMWIRPHSADELGTHLHAYSALRRLGIRLPIELEELFLRCTLDEMNRSELESGSSARVPLQELVGASSQVASTAPVKISYRLDGNGSLRLQIAGSIDINARQALIDAGTMARVVSPDVTIDTGDVDFIDAAGLGALIEIVELAHHEGVDVTMTRRSRSVQRLLDLTELGQQWP